MILVRREQACRMSVSQNADVSAPIGISFFKVFEGRDADD
jgi:hypothetical protein